MSESPELSPFQASKIPNRKPSVPNTGAFIEAKRETTDNWVASRHKKHREHPPKGLYPESTQALNTKP